MDPFEMFKDMAPFELWSPANTETGGTSAQHYDTLNIQSIDFKILEDSASRNVCQENSGDICLGNDQQHESLVFPEGEADAGTITTSDLESLKPMGFLSNTIIDFYVKYLEKTLSSEKRKRVYFFNSFFFTKLLGNSSSFTDIGERWIDYDQVRKWTGEVNIFEKDYVFIPVLRSSHWSLIIICHLSSLTSSPDERKVSPCILHLDPLEGRHERFEEHVRSYLLQTCLKWFQTSSKIDQMQVAVSLQVKYVQAKVPQQHNEYDSGLYVLHYVEVFLLEWTSQYFSFDSSKGGPLFTGPHFSEDVSTKRMAILKLCSELKPRVPRSMDILPNPQPIAVRKSKKRKFSKWNESETSVLLDLMVERGRIRKGTAGGTHWGQISNDIQMKFGTTRTEDECRRRYDTLLKAYKKIKSTGKEYCDITDAERSQANLATCLTEEWYKAIDIICLKRGADNSKFQKRAKLNPSDGNGTLSSSPRSPAAPPVSFGCSEAEKPSPKQVAIPGFSTLDEDLRFTFLNMIQALLMENWLERNRRCFDDPTVFELEVLCQWLAIVQDRRPSDIYIFMIKLFKLKLLNIECAILSSGPETKDGLISKERICLKLLHLRVYKRFLDKVICKNPNFDNYLEIRNNHDSVSFLRAPPLLSLQQIRVLSLYSCQELKQFDLSNFPELRSLAIEGCDNLEEITGWEVVKELGWLEIRSCRSCKDFPCVQCLPSLREFCFGSCGSLALRSALMPDFSQCVQLRRLEILENNISAMNMMDLSQLRFLEVLTLGCCYALTTIQGLSGLHSLTQLDLGCDALTRLPELGSLKSLIHLDLGSSGIEEISGVQELHMLTTLSLQYCHSLKRLPCLAHSKRLVYLDIRSSGVDEIPGVQDLVGLETLCCSGSRLKWLPDLHHLPRLQRVEVFDTPLSRMDPSSFYYGKGRLFFNSKEERKGFVDDISDISDSDEDSR